MKNGKVPIPNPLPKCTGWTIGGIWENRLVLKDTGKRVTSALVHDIDFSTQKEDYEAALELWDNTADGDESDRSSSDELQVNKKLLLKYFKSRENFAKTISIFHTYAVIDPDGNWHEQRDLLQPCKDETDFAKFPNWCKCYKEEFIDKADPNWMLTMLDCQLEAL